VDRGYIGKQSEQAAIELKIRRVVVKLPKPSAALGLHSVPHSPMVERSFGWGAHFWRLPHDNDRPT